MEQVRVDVPFWCHMQIAYRAHTVEAILEGSKGRRLRQEHQDPIHALV